MAWGIGGGCVSFSSSGPEKEPEEEREETEPNPTLLGRFQTFFEPQRRVPEGNTLERKNTLEKRIETPVPFPEKFECVKRTTIQGKTFYSFEVYSFEAMEEITYDQFRFIGKLELLLEDDELSTSLQEPLNSILSYKRRPVPFFEAVLGALGGSTLAAGVGYPEGLAIAFGCTIAATFFAGNAKAEEKRKHAYGEYRDLCAQVRELYSSEKEPGPYR